MLEGVRWRSWVLPKWPVRAALLGPSKATAATKYPARAQTGASIEGDTSVFVDTRPVIWQQWVTGQKTKHAQKEKELAFYACVLDPLFSAKP